MKTLEDYYCKHRDRDKKPDAKPIEFQDFKDQLNAKYPHKSFSKFQYALMEWAFKMGRQSVLTS